MSILSQSIVIRPSFIRLLGYLIVYQVPAYFFVYAVFNKCKDVQGCLGSAMISDWGMILFIVFVTAISTRRLHVIQIGGEDSLSPNILKGPGQKKIDLSKHYSLSSEKSFLKITQNEKSIKIPRRYYSKADFEKLLSLVKI